MAGESSPAGLSTMSPGIREARNYYRWLFREIGPRLGRNVLEIGPGWGQMLESVSASGRGYWAVDSDAGVIESLKTSYPACAHRLFHGDIAAPGTAALLRGAGVDTVLMMNILEHVERDSDFLSSIRTSFAGARLVIQVPAMPALYGRLDREAGHYRRYTRASLVKTLEKAGYAAEECFYFNFLGALTWFLAARLAQAELGSRSTGRMIALNDRLLIPVSPLLEPLTRNFLGQSLIAVAR